MKTRKIRIEGDGHIRSWNITDAETGEPIRATGLEIKLDAKKQEFPEVKISIWRPQLDISAVAQIEERTHPRWGKIAYEGYCRKTGGKSLATGDTLPKWDDLRQPIKEAWCAAVDAVVDVIEAEADKR